jgi:hypothetical protein
LYFDDTGRPPGGEDLLKFLQSAFDAHSSSSP